MQRLYEGLTNEEACKYEVSTIAKIGRKPDGPLLNMTDGGIGGPMPPERAAEHSRRMKGRKAPNKGVPMLAEQRVKCEATMFVKGQPAHNKGVPMSEEQVQFLRNRPISPETRAKMSAAKKGKPPHNKGKKMPSHQVEIMRKRQTGKKDSEITRKRKSEKVKEWSNTPEGRVIRSAGAKKRWEKEGARKAQAAIIAQDWARGNREHLRTSTMLHDPLTGRFIRKNGPEKD